MPEVEGRQRKPLALITGATKGIGYAVAEGLLRRGYRVMGVYGHDRAAADKVADDFAGYGDNFGLVQADLSCLDAIHSVETALDTMPGGGQRLEALILNAGITDRASFERTAPENWDRVLRTNLTVPFFLVQRFASRIPSKQGRIIFIGSVMGIRPHAISYAYGVSKAGVHFLAQSLVKEFSPRGVTVNVVAPGFVDTPMQASKTPEHRARIEKRTAIKRFAQAHEVAKVVEGLLDQGYVTGQIVAVDGGYDCA